MIRRLTFIVLFTLALLATALPVHALTPSVIVDVYVQIGYVGAESGTQAEPYSTLLEGKAFAQAQPDGGWIWVKQADGTWKRTEYVRPAISGSTGIPLAEISLYALLAILALGLILVGWKFQRRSAQLRTR